MREIKSINGAKPKGKCVHVVNVNVLHSSDTVRGAAAAMHPSSGPGQRGQELETTAQLPSTRHRSSRVSVHLPVGTM